MTFLPINYFLPEKNNHQIQGNLYIGELEEEYNVVSLKDIEEKVIKWYEIKKRNYKDFMEIRESSKNVALKNTINMFLEGINKIINKIDVKKDIITVEEI